MYSNNKNAPSHPINFFDMIKNSGQVVNGYSLEQLKQDIQNKQTYIFCFHLSGGTERLMVYTPL